MNNLK